MTTLASRLLSTARRTPSAPALSDGGFRADYATLADAALRFAGLLRAAGLRPGERLAVVAGNRFEAVAARYGGWLAGAIVVPLNAQASRRELAAWLAHCEPAVVLAESGNGEALAAIEASGVARVLLLRPDTDPHWPGVGEAGPEPVLPGRGDVGLILYTSGTTGAPKGVVLAHGAIAANVDAVVEDLQLASGDCTVGVLPFHYAYGASVLQTHLAVGAHVVLERNLVFPHLIARALRDVGATGFSGVSSTFALLLERGAFDDVQLPRLRYLTQAGGAMPLALLRRLRGRFPGVRVHLMYGQTEATARLASVPPERVADKPGAAGRPLRGVQLQIRDDAGQVLPAGGEGEVWARSRGLMQGYWRDPAATALALRDGWLRTGDIGRMDAEGFLFLAGRRGDMIKTGAHRVHPLDVEEALLEHPGIAEAAVAGVPDGTLGQVVKAWVVASAPGLSADLVRAHCRGRLAPWKIPRHVDFVPTLPRTGSGKIRRAALGQAAALEAAP